MLPFALAGSVVALAVLMAAWRMRRLPAHRSCPVCSAETVRVEREGVEAHLPSRIVRRWCGHCGWSGLARRGVDPDPITGPSAHDSGFRWNRSEEVGQLPRFTWGTGAPPERSGPDPGFRWRRDPNEPPESEWMLGDRPVDSGDRDPLTGFRWRRPRSPSRDLSGFSFREGSSDESEEDEGFTWGDRKP